jgi:hypothetical protein
LDTLSVAELFDLLSTASKTGALRFATGTPEAGAFEATVFVAGGLCCGVESDEVGGPAGSEDELAVRLVEVGFSVARQPAGSFRFSDAEPPPFTLDHTTKLGPAVAEITSMLDQWREIEATIPSLDVRVRLAPVLRSEDIVLSAHEWKLLVALEGTPTVREVVADQRSSMIEVCRGLKALIDRGAIEVGTDMGRADLRSHGGSGSQSVASSTATSLLDPSEPYAPAAGGADSEVEAVAAVEAEAVAAGLVSRLSRARRPVPDAFAGADDSPVIHADFSVDPGHGSGPTESSESATGDDSQDRGALLRLFSALKE